MTTVQIMHFRGDPIRVPPGSKLIGAPRGFKISEGTAQLASRNTINTPFVGDYSFTVPMGNTLQDYVYHVQERENLQVLRAQGQASMERTRGQLAYYREFDQRTKFLADRQVKK